MRVVFLTGIWPPDVGGPATHGPEFARFLVERGHEVTVVTMGGRDFHNIRLFVRRDGKWKLLGWANEAVPDSTV